jgi:hypothetical protein
MSETARRVAERHLTATKKPNDIVVPVTAVASADGKTYQHEVLIRPSTYAHKAGQPIVVIDGTPGQWYADDFLTGRGPLYIDFGQRWVLDNADEVREAVKRLLKEQGGAPEALPIAAEPAIRYVRLLSEAAEAGNERSSRRWLHELLTVLGPLVGALEGPQVQRDLEQIRVKLRR